MNNKMVGFILVDTDLKFFQKTLNLIDKKYLAKLAKIDFEVQEKALNVFYVKLTKQNFSNLILNFIKLAIMGVYSQKLVKFIRMILTCSVGDTKNMDFLKDITIIGGEGNDNTTKI